MTQVLEPATLDAVCGSAEGSYYLLIAGRGTQLMSMQA